MAGRRNRRKRDDDASSGDWRHLLPVGGLIAAVLFTLALGAVLRTDSQLPATASPAPASADDLPAVQAEPPAAAAPPDDGPFDLAQRAANDARRIRASSSQWTLQFMLACDPVNVRPRIAGLVDRPDFFLLPKQHDGQSCFRLCWGRFPTRAQALATTSYPEDLHEITAKPQALQIARALQ